MYLLDIKTVSALQNLDFINAFFKGGFAGGLAGIIQVFLMMWIRTTISYQYRHGLTTKEALTVLYKQGGIRRFYRGISFALIQAPLSRFGSVASNEGASVLASHISNNQLKMLLTTTIGSLFACLWRILLMPIDTLKTVLQVDGLHGFHLVLEKLIINRDIGALYQGTLATAFGAAIAHYSWFLVYNGCYNAINTSNIEQAWLNALVNALIGLLASVFSDVLCNPIRVLKTVKQSAAASLSERRISYLEILTHIHRRDGLVGLFSRGLATRVVSNGLQSMVFNVLLRSIMAKLTSNTTGSSSDSTSSNNSSQ